MRKKEKAIAKTETEAQEAAGTAVEAGGETKAVPVKKKNPKNKRLIKKALIITGAAIIVVGAAVFFLGGKGGEQMDPPVTAGTVELQDLAQEVSIKGAIQGSESADITSALNSKITSILVEEGDRVSKGQVMAVLDGGDLTDQYKKAQVALAQSKKDYETTQALYAEGAVAKSELDRAKATYDSDSITVGSFDGLDDTKVKSPIDGVVTRVNVTLGRMAQDRESNEAMFVVENLDNLQMKVKISEYDISKIKEGQEVTITADVLGDQSVTGTVSKISPTGEQKEQGSKEMVIPVVIDVNKGDSNLIAGVTAKATILIEKKTNALTVPIDALLEDPATGETVVFIIKDNVLKRVVVTVGLEGDFSVEISSGELAAGDQVVLAPTNTLTDGMAVTLAGQPV